MQVQDYKYKRILVVDDEEFCLAAIKALMSIIGIDIIHHVDFCMDGMEALDTFIQSYQNGLRYSVILTDFKMPKMDGI